MVMPRTCVSYTIKSSSATRQWCRPSHENGAGSRVRTRLRGGPVSAAPDPAHRPARGTHAKGTSSGADSPHRTGPSSRVA